MMWSVFFSIFLVKKNLKFLATRPEIRSKQGRVHAISQGALVATTDTRSQCRSGEGGDDDQSITGT